MGTPLVSAHSVPRPHATRQPSVSRRVAGFGGPAKRPGACCSPGLPLAYLRCPCRCAGVPAERSKRPPARPANRPKTVPGRTRQPRLPPPSRVNGPGSGSARGTFHSAAPLTRAGRPNPGIADRSARASKLLQCQPTLEARTPCLRPSIRSARDESPTAQHPFGAPDSHEPKPSDASSPRRATLLPKEASHRPDLTIGPHAPVERTSRGDRRELGHHHLMATSPPGVVSPVDPLRHLRHRPVIFEKWATPRHRRANRALPSSRSFSRCGAPSRQVSSTPDVLPAGAFHTTRAGEPTRVTPS